MRIHFLLLRQRKNELPLSFCSNIFYLRNNTTGTLQMNAKVFTRGQANALIPLLTPLIQQLREQQARIHVLEHEFHLIKMMADNNIHMSSDNDITEKKSVYNRSIFQANLLLTRIQEYGCLVKDIDMGLIDFLSDFDGKPVFLCWKVGEKEILYYHELNEGFQGRRHIWFDR